ncbi:MAG: CDGSH iron-sulfur domain-containing protein [Candidatus Eisenbacteria bacterium]
MTSTVCSRMLPPVVVVTPAGEECPMDDKLHKFETDAITVTWSRARCIHAAACIQGLPEVFEPGRRPWVMPANASTDEVAAVVRRCPTGALHFTRLDGGPAEGAPERNFAIVGRAGPIYLRGDLRLVDAEGREVTRETRLALCRCGATKHRPFCDGEHWEVQFRDAGRLPEVGLQPGDGDTTQPPSGPVIVEPTENGPVRIEGEIEFLAGDGQTRRRGVRAELCRCGRSENKPFCDGSHRAAGFTAEPLS